VFYQRKKWDFAGPIKSFRGPFALHARVRHSKSPSSKNEILAFKIVGTYQEVIFEAFFIDKYTGNNERSPKIIGRSGNTFFFAKILVKRVFLNFSGFRISKSDIEIRLWLEGG
jgi:hypothetical protein